MTGTPAEPLSTLTQPTRLCLGCSALRCPCQGGCMLSRSAPAARAPHTSCGWTATPSRPTLCTTTPTSTRPPMNTTWEPRPGRPRIRCPASEGTATSTWTPLLPTCTQLPAARQTMTTGPDNAWLRLSACRCVLTEACMARWRQPKVGVALHAWLMQNQLWRSRIGTKELLWDLTGAAAQCGLSACPSRVALTARLPP